MTVSANPSVNSTQDSAEASTITSTTPGAGTRLEKLAVELRQALSTMVSPTALASLTVAFGEITIVVPAIHYRNAMHTLRDHPALLFEEFIDLCGVDYLSYGQTEDQIRTGANQPANKPAARFAAVVHLLSITHNWRVRVRVFAENDELPVLPSVTSIWSAANWYEREAFDLYGLLFEEHPDLRRLLTDYGFIGHPFRKDFPVSGYVEMRYDEEQKRVIYQPLTIQPRELTPYLVREQNYAANED